MPTVKQDITQELIAELINVLKGEKKIFLDKECKSEILRHTFYIKSGSIFHVRYSYAMKNLQSPKFKDYPSIESTDENIEKTVADILHNYYEYNNYVISIEGK